MRLTTYYYKHLTSSLLVNNLQFSVSVFGITTIVCCSCYQIAIYVSLTYPRGANVNASCLNNVNTITIYNDTK